MSMPGFSAEASLHKPHGYYHSAHAFTAAGGNALLPAQWCCAPEPHPPLMPWSASWACDWRCLGRCEARCRSWCPRGDLGCFVECRDPWCFIGCNCEVP
jgi:hypothetical protein